MLLWAPVVDCVALVPVKVHALAYRSQVDEKWKLLRKQLETQRAPQMAVGPDCQRHLLDPGPTPSEYHAEAQIAVATTVAPCPRFPSEKPVLLITNVPDVAVETPGLTMLCARRRKRGTRFCVLASSVTFSISQR